MGIIQRATRPVELSACQTYSEFDRALDFRRKSATMKKNYLAQIQGGAFCVYCGKADSHLCLDHLHPKALGGPDTLWNLVLACGRCNNLKGDYEPAALFNMGYPELARRVIALEAARDNGNGTLDFGISHELPDYDFKQYDNLERFRATAGFGEWIAAQLDRCSMSISRFRKEMGISGWQPERWLSGQNLPSIVYFRQMCELFGVPIDSVRERYNAAAAVKRKGMLLTKKANTRKKIAEFDAEFDAVFDAEFDAVFAMQAVVLQENALLTYIARRAAFGTLLKQAFASVNPHVKEQWQAAMDIHASTMTNIFSGRAIPGYAISTGLFKLLRFSPKRFFECVTDLASQSHFREFVVSTALYRCSLLTLKLRKYMHANCLTQAMLASRLGMSESLLHNLVSKNFTHSETQLRNACEKLGIDAADVPPVGVAKPTPLVFHYFDTHAVALTTAGVQRLLRQKMAALTHEELLPLARVRVAVGQCFEELFETYPQGTTGFHAMFLKHMVAGRTLPSRDTFQKLLGSYITPIGFYSRVSDRANALDTDVPAVQAFYKKLRWKRAIAIYRVSTGRSFVDIASDAGVTEDYIYQATCSVLSQRIDKLEALCKRLGITEQTYRLPVAAVQMRSAITTSHYAALLSSLHGQLTFGGLTDALTRRRYIGFRVALSQELTAALTEKDTTRAQLGRAVGLHAIRIGDVCNARTLPSPKTLENLLKTLSLEPDVFWCRVHQTLTAPGFLDALPRQLLETARLKYEISTIVDSTQATYAEFADTYGVDKSQLDRAGSQYLPASPEGLNTLLSILRTLSLPSLSELGRDKAGRMP